MELAGSLRLFGGLKRLHRRILAEGRMLGLQQLAWAPTSLGALALARSGHVNGLTQPLPPLLDALPLTALSAVQAQAPMLARLGCRRLADVRALPRAALAKRFGPALLQSLDQAYGLTPESHRWLQVPETFCARIELPFRVDAAPALRHHAEALLLQLCAWLAARHAGVLQLELAWQHDSMRARDSAAGGALILASAEPTRDFKQLARLLAEHLARLQLAAPVSELRLQAAQVLPLPAQHPSLLPLAHEPSSSQAQEPLPQLLERLAVRLGADHIRRAQRQADHRPECMQRWLSWPIQPAPAQKYTAKSSPPVSDTAQPTWLLAPPLRLATWRDQPVYQGLLQMLAGPARVEDGWWDAKPSAAAPHVQRDYYLARNPQAELLWIFHERLDTAQAGWFLHGIFA
ncbi:MAG: DNA polymerase Y family protein [Burkholderiaceae bacterium]|nr:DNA polymerase Y family protein [Burkholderiaceae bacterium]